jgi:hypothetical protein
LAARQAASSFSLPHCDIFFVMIAGNTKPQRIEMTNKSALLEAGAFLYQSSIYR